MSVSVNTIVNVGIWVRRAIGWWVEGLEEEDEEERRGKEKKRRMGDGDGEAGSRYR